MPKKEKELPLFKTIDLNVASTLVSLGFPIVKLEHIDDRKRKFVFHSSDRLLDAIDKYWNNQLLINPRLVLDSYRNLKGRIWGSLPYDDEEERNLS